MICKIELPFSRVTKIYETSKRCFWELEQRVVEMGTDVECLTVLPRLTFSTEAWPITIRAFIFITAVLNISGNSLLLYGLQRTGQTKTISFQYIIILSASDLATGVSSLVFLTLLTYEQHNQHCWLMKFTQSIVFTCCNFSMSMVLIIAFDRFLHMKLLERYSAIVTKKRGRLLTLIAFIFSATTTLAVFVLPFNKRTFAILKCNAFAFSVLMLLFILKLYYNACHIVQANSNQLVRSIFTQNRALEKAAKRIAICLIAMTIPVMVMLLIDVMVDEETARNLPMLLTLTWLSCITLFGNGFCSSCIFISQNRPIRLLFKSELNIHFNRINCSSQIENSDN